MDNRTKNKIIWAAAIGVWIIVILFIVFTFFNPFATSPSELLRISDAADDFVVAEGNRADVTIGLSPVDIKKVEVSNDGSSFLIAIITEEPLPEIGPTYPDCYVCSVHVMADNDGNKLASADIIIDDLGWDFGTGFTKDSEKIRYKAEGNTVTFMFPLDMIDWGGSPETMSFYVEVGYENYESLARIYDFVPNQQFLDFNYYDYKLWKD